MATALGALANLAAVALACSNPAYAVCNFFIRSVSSFGRDAALLPTESQDWELTGRVGEGESSHRLMLDSRTAPWAVFRTISVDALCRTQQRWIGLWCRRLCRKIVAKRFALQHFDNIV